MFARVAATLVLALLAASPASRAADASLETRVKAAYIVNFLTFVDWEAGGSEPAAASTRICVLGDDAVLPLLKDLSGREVRGRPLQVVGASKVGELRDCQLLVIGRSETARLPDVFRHVAGLSVLTVSDIPGFSRSGGVIGFVTEGDRVKIEINQRAAGEARLRISAKLLEVARLVP